MSTKKKTSVQKFRQAIRDIQTLDLFNHPACNNVLKCMAKNSALVTDEVVNQFRSLQITYKPVTRKEGLLTTSYPNLKCMEDIHLITSIEIHNDHSMSFEFSPAEILLLAKVANGIVEDIGDRYTPQNPSLLKAIKHVVDNTDL